MSVASLAQTSERNRAEEDGDEAGERNEVGTGSKTGKIN